MATHSRARTALCATVALLGLCTACEPTQPAGAAAACDFAGRALQSLSVEGFSPGTFELVDALLEAAQEVQADDVLILYQASYVGDAYRGPAPQLTLPTTLSDMVQTCAQAGY